VLPNKQVLTVMKFKHYIKSKLKRILLNVGQFMFLVILETTVETDYNGQLCIVDLKSAYHEINTVHDVIHITPKVQKDLMQQKEFLDSCSDYFVKYMNKVTIYIMKITNQCL
jgi:hypothetical protein